MAFTDKAGCFAAANHGLKKPTSTFTSTDLLHLPLVYCRGYAIPWSDEHSKIVGSPYRMVYMVHVNPNLHALC